MTLIQIVNMNERIRELLLQATTLRGPPFIRFKVDQEKFAKLIIRKCADIGERYADGNYEVPNQILEYFGLEEEEWD